MKKNIREIFKLVVSTVKPLFILEMANNHMGDVGHGLKIIREFHKITKKFDFHFAFKFQYRNIDTFIHPEYKNRMDIKYVKRFSETRLSPSEFLSLKKEAESLGYISICTPFDEESVDLIEKHNYSVIKVGSCSFADWPLLERIIKVDKPVVLSTGGASLQDIDNVVSFFHHRKKKFAIMHCVGEYPTVAENLQLNQITFFKNRYADVVVGFSTHEDPDDFVPVQLAVAKGAQIFERHVAIKTKKYDINAYSSLPSQVESWLVAAQRAIKIGGVVEERVDHSKKEMVDIRQFKRGVFAKRSFKKGELIKTEDVFFAFPNQLGQLVANQISKYKYYYAKKAIKKNGVIKDVRLDDTREEVYAIVKRIDKLFKKSGVVFPNRVDLEISHHYGLDKFDKYGICMVTCVNRGYCKKLIIMFPGQLHPEQYHRKKEETFHVLYGKFIVWLNDKKHIFLPGDVVVIEPTVRHRFTTVNGGILEEISSTHFVNDSFYIDEKISLNKNRKTHVRYWRNVV
ncbi:N-acetylneuraminate synthase family protein [Patescibacteria group bacterium]|nr:N-acetylneuraminate synthase family protein [Patescibacteria group bacterium]MCG2702547.1 N-acetylneuraminate synthase family protein [Candidatus Parcubacteria bacterium]MBU4265103.1 N-acetylneuraminate synthase family protein [Patescibacteria group bacterium]MBU4390667.1 N-acetylneuraminate synthase family protein [Patescibacteria group bacterium]MBU4396620.1 N-acetylneuraminate synthase family protein [Patescibacteria group bacterium]